MSTHYPPRLASALMRWMGPRDEALVGDLLEEHRNGRSDWWYWRQVLAAIVIGAVTAVRSHSVLAIRAVALGWCFLLLYVNYAGSSVLVAVRPVFNFSDFLFVTGLTDWFYVHRIHFPATVVQSGPTMVMALIGAFASGWLVGSCHRSQGASMVLVYCASLPLPTVAAVLWEIAANGRYAGPPLLPAAAFLIPLVYLPALVGGLWAARARHQAASIRPD
jgi:hypothetical protein